MGNHPKYAAALEKLSDLESAQICTPTFGTGTYSPDSHGTTKLNNGNPGSVSPFADSDRFSGA